MLGEKIVVASAGTLCVAAIAIFLPSSSTGFS